MPNVGLATTSTNSAPGRDRSTVTSPVASSACRPTWPGSGSWPVTYSKAPSTPSIRLVSGDGAAGSMIRSQLRTTSDGLQRRAVRELEVRAQVEDDPLAAVLDPPRLGERRAHLAVGIERRERLEQLGGDLGAARVALGGRVERRRGAGQDAGDPRRVGGRPRAGCQRQRHGQQPRDQAPATHRGEYTGGTQFGPQPRSPGSGLRWRHDPAPAQHAEPVRRAGDAARARTGVDVHLRTDRLPLRPRRQPAQLPARRPHPAGPAVPRPRRVPRQEHHRRRPPARRALRSRRGPDARPGRPRVEDAGRDRRRLRGRLPCRRGRGEHPAGERLPAGDGAHPRDDRAGRAARRTPGLAYASDAGNLYYSVGSFPGYGRLSGNTLDALRAGHRGEVEPDKRDPADFALWKAAGDGRILRWDTPRWGAGLPGLAPRVLGDGDALPGRSVRHPHRRHRQHLPAPRGRDRPVGAARRRRRRRRSGSTASIC